MSREDVDRIVAGYEAWNRRDLDAALAPISPEIEWSFHGGTQVPGSDDVYHGHDGVRRFWSEFLDPWESLTIEIEEVKEAGATVVVFTRFRGTGAGSGVELEAPFVHLWELRDGLAVRFEAFDDRDEALQATGLSG